MKKQGGNMVLWFAIVIVVIGVLVFLTVNRKAPTPMDSQLGSVEGSTENKVEETQNNMENTTQTDGVKITILQEGNGEVAKSGDTVAMNYTGKLTDGTVFDSNVDPKFGHVQPFVFTIDAGMVIKGWDVGVAGMKVGEKRNLLITPEFGYGATGAGNIIPPNATLSFDVELVAIKK